MKPQTISRKRSAPKGTVLFNILAESFNPKPFETTNGHNYSPININPEDYVKCGESANREFFKLKT